MRKKSNSNMLGIILSFSGAYLLGVVILHLLPEVFMGGDAASNRNTAGFVLAGFFIQLILVQFTRGIEHGHLHLHEHFSKGYVSGVFIGLGIHALLEGLPLGGGNMPAEEVQPLYWGIFIHKLPETFALATVLFFSAKKSLWPLLLIILFASITPLGSVLGQFFTGSADPETRFHWMIAIVCGSLTHISTTIIFEASGKAHKLSVIKFLAIIGGFLFSLLSLIL
ncbi:MAG: ZIP family metal transporter [Chitinophagales bacterium]